jgi:hypothetical protein
MSNATCRSLINNMAIASGPQVVINDEMVSPTESGDDLYPWKRWHVQGDPLGNQRDPVTFFQPQSNAGELLQVLQAINTWADEASAIPRYLTGESLSGGAGRTSSGLAMLMSNAQKVLQTVAANVDGDVLEPLLEALYDMIMLTDTSGMLTGEEEITVKGSLAAIQRETERQKQLQFLQITANPIDAPIIGEVGRARILRAIAADLGLPDDIVPDDQTLQSQIQAQKQAQAASQALLGHAQAQGAVAPGHPGPGHVTKQTGSGGGGAGSGAPPMRGAGSPPAEPAPGAPSMGGGAPAPPMNAPGQALSPAGGP